MRNQIWKKAIFVFAAAATFALAARPASASDPWKPEEVIEPQALAAELAQPDKPVIIQVGFKALFYGGHIPGAHYCGPARDADGIASLKNCLAKFSKTQTIVIYCGCCPMVRCPNLRPAYALVHQMGFDKVKVLDIPNDFPTDWTKKGLPTTPPAGVPGAKGTP
jgi:thiosulfate/3-mercaptopyruvate sulfurtransferase